MPGIDLRRVRAERPPAVVQQIVRRTPVGLTHDLNSPPVMLLTDAPLLHDSQEQSSAHLARDNLPPVRNTESQCAAVLSCDTGLCRRVETRELDAYDHE